jgi:hypothetical protein
MTAKQKESHLKAIVEGLKEVARLLVLSLPALLIELLTDDPNLAAGYGTLILFVLRALDKYIHENPNINKNGLLPF